MLASITLALLITVVSVTGYGAIAVGKTTRKLPIYCVDTPNKQVALSFDASWGADKTLDILSVLSNYGIKANFFCVGFWAEKYADTLKKLQDSGVMEIGTHSNSHGHMSKFSKAQIEEDLSLSLSTIERITGTRPNLFRAPYGEYSDTLITTAQSLGLYTIQWDVDTLDWKGLTANQIATRVLNKAKSGSIILMHNDGEHTVKSLPLIIEGLKNKGYEFVTIGELIYKDNYEIDHTGKQIRLKDR
ncbi:MAG: polysaccharide deacetylase family protein [Clostridia bacterium]|nr:polysaccharide deacetylase family protein [Clostridia bacterium]